MRFTAFILACFLAASAYAQESFRGGRGNGSGSSSVTNVILSSGPTNGSVGAQILTAGVGITLTTSGTNLIVSSTNGPLTIVTNDYALNTLYTNTGISAYVSMGFNLTPTLTEASIVVLCVDQANDGTYETRKTNQNSSGVAQLAVSELSAFLSTNSSFVFSNLSVGSATATISPLSGRKATGFGGGSSSSSGVALSAVSSNGTLVSSSVTNINFRNSRMVTNNSGVVTVEMEPLLTYPVGYVNALVAASAPDDVITLGPGIYPEILSIRFPHALNFIGAGTSLTIISNAVTDIVSNVIVNPYTDSSFQKLTITGGKTVQQAPLGCRVTENAFTNVVLIDVHLFGSIDNIFISHTNACSMSLDHVTGESTWDNFFIDLNTNSIVVADECKFYSDGTSSDRAAFIKGGQLIMKGGEFDCKSLAVIVGTNSLFAATNTVFKSGTDLMTISNQNSMGTVRLQNTVVGRITGTFSGKGIMTETNLYMGAIRGSVLYTNGTPGETQIIRGIDSAGTLSWGSPLENVSYNVSYFTIVTNINSYTITPYVAGNPGDVVLVSPTNTPTATVGGGGRFNVNLDGDGVVISNMGVSIIGSTGSGVLYVGSAASFWTTNLLQLGSASLVITNAAKGFTNAGVTVLQQPLYLQPAASTNTSQISLFETNGVNSVTWQGPDNLTNSFIIVPPTNHPTAGQVLSVRAYSGNTVSLTYSNDASGGASGGGPDIEVMRRTVVQFDDLFHRNYSTTAGVGPFGLLDAVGGTGATVAGVSGTTNAPGIVRCNLGTQATNWSELYVNVQGAESFLLRGVYTNEWRFRLSATNSEPLGDSTNNYRFYCGFADLSSTSTSPIDGTHFIDGIFLRCDTNNENFVYISRVNSVAVTNATTLVPVANTWYKFRSVTTVTTSVTNSVCTIDDAQSQTFTTAQVPNAASRLTSLYFGGSKADGTDTVTFELDYLYLGYSLEISR